MSDAKVVAAMQRQAAEAEVERLRLVGELEAMRLKLVDAESMLASISGVTRLELVAAERAKRDGLLAALKGLMAAALSEYVTCDCPDHSVCRPSIEAARAAIAAAEAAP